MHILSYIYSTFQPDNPYLRLWTITNCIHLFAANTSMRYASDYVLLEIRRTYNGAQLLDPFGTLFKLIILWIRDLVII